MPNFACCNVDEYIGEQTPEIYLTAVKQDGFALEHVNEQTPEICMATVQQNGNALKYVKKTNARNMFSCC